MFEKRGYEGEKYGYSCDILRKIHFILNKILVPEQSYILTDTKMLKALLILYKILEHVLMYVYGLVSLRQGVKELWVQCTPW